MFQVCVSSVTFLVSLMSPTQELLFLEGVQSTNSASVLSVHIRNVVESFPEDRLVSLVCTV
jgi:hypothetical protein